MLILAKSEIPDFEDEIRILEPYAVYQSKPASLLDPDTPVQNLTPIHHLEKARICIVNH